MGLSYIPYSRRQWTEDVLTEQYRSLVVLTIEEIQRLCSNEQGEVCICVSRALKESLEKFITDIQVPKMKKPVDHWIWLYRTFRSVKYGFLMRLRNERSDDCNTSPSLL